MRNLAPKNESRLRLDSDGFALLHRRLREANVANNAFDAHYARLADVLGVVLERIQNEFGDVVERVLAVGDWAHYGTDLRNLPYDEIVIHIVLRSDERPFDLYMRIADRVFSELSDKDIFVQFDLETLPEWQHTESLAHDAGHEDALGIPLLSR